MASVLLMWQYFVEHYYIREKAEWISTALHHGRCTASEDRATASQGASQRASQVRRYWTHPAFKSVCLLHIAYVLHVAHIMHMVYFLHLVYIMHIAYIVHIAYILHIVHILHNCISGKCCI